MKGKTVDSRLDSGFYEKDVFDYLEKPDRPINYIVAACFILPFNKCWQIKKSWLKVDKGIEIAECEYQSPFGKALKDINGQAISRPTSASSR